jgi:hypothetical protein
MTGIPPPTHDTHIAGSEPVVLHSGHFAHLKEPWRFAEVVTRFVTV